MIIDLRVDDYILYLIFIHILMISLSLPLMINFLYWWKLDTSIQINKKERTGWCQYPNIPPLQQTTSNIIYKLPLKVPNPLPLSSSTISNEQAKKIHKAHIPFVISAMGYNKTWPRELRFGTHNYCSLQLKHCGVEATRKKSKASEHCYTNKIHQKPLPSCLHGTK